MESGSDGRYARKQLGCKSWTVSSRMTRLHKFRYDLIYGRPRSLYVDLQLTGVSFWMTLVVKWDGRGKKH
jgi:hypothetical protein